MRRIRFSYVGDGKYVCSHKGDYTGEYVDTRTVEELLETLRDLTFQAEPYHVISVDRAESVLREHRDNV